MANFSTLLKQFVLAIHAQLDVDLKKRSKIHSYTCIITRSKFCELLMYVFNSIQFGFTKLLATVYFLSSKYRTRKEMMICTFSYKKPSTQTPKFMSNNC